MVLLIYYTGASQVLLVLAEKRLVNIIKVVTKCIKAPVAQLDRALPSEGRGHRFESCRVHHSFQYFSCICAVLQKLVAPMMLHGGQLWHLYESAMTVGKYV